MEEFLTVYQFIFSSFWIWAGTWFLIVGAVGAIPSAIRLVRG